MSAPFALEPALRGEVVVLLQELIRIDTVNPPGNETRAAELLRDYLAESGVTAELVAKEPGRDSLVARLPGRGEGPSLAFLSHTDTVVADASEWSVDPWSGSLEDGHVWGRGALDMKGQVAASAVAIASLARDGFRPAGDIVFLATADEEVGVDVGLSWLCREHPDLVRVDYAINEGSGE
ncbi:MAG: M20/M25/M40 family metallo-hydrolase, partial [Gaiellaceae bacterium]